MKALVHCFDYNLKKFSVVEIPDVTSIRFRYADENVTFGGIGVYVSNRCLIQCFDSDDISYIRFED